MEKNGCHRSARRDVRRNTGLRPSMAGTDDVARSSEASFVSSYAGLAGRMKTGQQHLPSGVEVFCLDGVALVNAR